MDLNQVDEKTEQWLMEIAQEGNFEEHTAMLVRVLHETRREEGLTDEEAELLSYIVINKLSSEMANYLAGFMEMEDK
jgi:hypothetical protein